jgi:hypothetical protein
VLQRLVEPELYACGCWRGSRRWRRWPRISKEARRGNGRLVLVAGEAGVGRPYTNPLAICCSQRRFGEPPPRNVAVAHASRLGSAAAAKCRERTRKTG